MAKKTTTPGNTKRVKNTTSMKVEIEVEGVLLVILPGKTAEVPKDFIVPKGILIER